ncbi:MAG TPA: YceI family protein [Burkholderiales bacterium]
MSARWVAALLLALVAGACVRQLPPVAPAAPPGGAIALPEGFPAAEYERAAARGEPVYRIDPERSLVVVRVYRAGPLARFGHDHVVASRSVQGYALLAPEGSRADLYAPLAQLTVDEPALRAAAGFDSPLSASDIEGTRRNMLEALEAARFPFVSVHLRSEGGALRAEVSLHGATRPVSVAAAVEHPGAEAVHARGRFSLRQTDFGIRPFAFLGGALQVRDRVDIDFDVYGARVDAAGIRPRAE